MKFIMAAIRFQKLCTKISRVSTKETRKVLASNLVNQKDVKVAKVGNHARTSRVRNCSNFNSLHCERPSAKFI